MKKIIEEYTLSALGVDQISERISGWLKENHESSRNIARMRLTIEEMLLSMKDHFGDGYGVSLCIKKTLGIPSIHLYCQGEPFNPIDMSQSQDEWSEQFLKNIGLSPIWAYRKGVNEISLRSVRTGHRSELNLLVALLVTLILGFIGPLMPNEVLNALKSCFSAVTSIFIRLLNTFAGVMVFMCIINGICGIGNISEFTKIGRKMISRYMIYSLVCTILVTAFFNLFYQLPFGQSSSGETQFMAIFNLIFSILPENPVKPFLELNMLQIAVIGVFLGLLIIVNVERMSIVKSFFQDCNILATDSIRIVCKMLPLYIVSSLTVLLWENGYDVILKLWKPILLITVFVLVFAILVTLRVSMNMKLSPLVLAKKLFPSTLIGLTTASSVAAFSTVLETCEKKLGIESKFAKVAIPLGHLTFNAPYSCIFVIPSFYFAYYYNMEVNFLWFVQLVLLSVLLAMSVPPIPGTFLACITIIFSQLNISSDGLSIAATLGLLTDFILTAGRIYLNMLEILTQAKSNNNPSPYIKTEHASL